VVQQWLGHKTLKMTLRYAHLAPVNLLSAVKVLEVTTPTDTIRPIPMPNPVVTGVTPAATVKAETA
jgi:hypothetical protein